MFLCLAYTYSYAQNDSKSPVYKDYQDNSQFKNFRKRRIIVGAWQINKLKTEGAIVVKLKTNNLAIEQLIKQEKKELAIEKQLEQFAVNKNTMLAYMENFNFCKVYFIYSGNSDSLLAGKRTGIFLDTNLRVDPSITMTEKFYLIAEKDFAYTSSIGFVPEASAKQLKETGNPIKMMAIVLKNKYGHQLKKPIPYATTEKSFINTKYTLPIKYIADSTGYTDSITYQINRTLLMTIKESPPAKPVYSIETRAGKSYISSSVKLSHGNLYEKLSSAVSRLNSELYQTLRKYPQPNLKRVKPEFIDFLY